jgi:hypothetical protein
MSSCDNSNIRKNYIVSGVEQDILSACTGFYTNDIYPCTDDTIIVHSDVLSANTINSSVFLSGGTNLLDIFGSMDTNTFVTGVTYDNSNNLSVDRNDGVSFEVNISEFSGLTINGVLSACTGIYTSNLYGCSPITVQDDLILLSGLTLSAITNDDSLTEILVRDSVTGLVKYRDVSSITPDTNTFVTGTTLDSNLATVTRNDDIDVLLLSGGSNVTLSNPSSNQINIDVSIPPDTNTFVSASTLSGSTLVLTRNDGVELTTDLSPLPILDLGRILFVTETGDDSTGTKGDINKPFRNLYAAKSASTSGDTVYVFPGTWTYDNTNAAGNPYNGNMNTLVNLWKDGVSYYFSPNSKIIFYNQTVDGEDMYLFTPPNTGTTVESCSVYGELEWEGSSIGGNSSMGNTGFHTIFGIYDNSYRFSGKVKSLVSKSSGVVYGGIYGYSGNTEGSFTLDADLIEVDYQGGQSGNGAAVAVQCDGKFITTINVKEIGSSFHPFYLRSDSYNEGTRFVANVDYMYGNSFAILQRHPIGEEFIFNINNGTFGASLLRNESITTGTTTINGNFRTITNTTFPIFNLASTQPNTLVFNGTIKPDNTSGDGRRIFQTNSGNQKVIANCNILYESDLTTSSRIFEVNSGDVTFDGIIEGNFSGPIARVISGGKLTIKNSEINSSFTGGTLFSNTNTTNSKVIVKDSKIILNNSVSDLYDGQYLNTYILNSSIKNNGSSDIFTNTTVNGLLQLHNSSLVCTSGNTINISGTAPLTVAGTMTNTPVSATNISGTITEITELDIE